MPPVRPAGWACRPPRSQSRSDGVTLGRYRFCRKEVVMRRLAVPAALACLVMLALPGAVKASGVGRDDRCPAGPSRVASHTEIEPSADGLSVGIDFALREGCEAVDVSLLSYQLVAGRTLLDPAEQVLYDVSTAAVSAGRVNHLEVAVIPDCWSLVKLVVGRPPAGEADSGRIRAWDRRN